MKKIYIYPYCNLVCPQQSNDYLKLFYQSFVDSDKRVLNRFHQLRIANVVFNLDADCFVFHWVDTIPFARLGGIQSVIFMVELLVLKILCRKIVWIMHNKHAHSGHSYIGEVLMRQMAKYATVVIVHSSDGIQYFNKTFSKFSGKCHYIPHPVYASTIFPNAENLLWDIVIWGSIEKRKGIVEFMEFVNCHDEMRSKKILIAGSCKDKSYLAKILEIKPDNVDVINKFLTKDELQEYIGKSKIILFAYNGDSILSSGALIYSLNYKKPIIGPAKGNFVDLPGVVSCYASYEDIPDILHDLDFNGDLVLKYMSDNTWDSFPSKLEKCFEFISK